MLLDSLKRHKKMCTTRSTSIQSDGEDGEDELETSYIVLVVSLRLQPTTTQSTPVQIDGEDID